MRNDQLNIAELPELPEPWIRNLSVKDPAAMDHYATDQMRSYALAAQAPLIEHIKELERVLANVRGLAVKWNKDAIDTGFAMSEPAYELFEVLDAATNQGEQNG